MDEPESFTISTITDQDTLKMHDICSTKLSNIIMRRDKRIAPSSQQIVTDSEVVHNATASRPNINEQPHSSRLEEENQQPRSSLMSMVRQWVMKSVFPDKDSPSTTEPSEQVGQSRLLCQ